MFVVYARDWETHRDGFDPPELVPGETEKVATVESEKLARCMVVQENDPPFREAWYERE